MNIDISQELNIDFDEMLKISHNWNKLWMLNSKFESTDREDLITSKDNIKYVFIPKKDSHVWVKGCTSISPFLKGRLEHLLR